MVKALILVLFLQLSCTNQIWSLPTGEAIEEESDPCSGTVCGKGAECRLVSSLVVCICDDNSMGDPFVECKPIPNASDMISESTTISQTLTSTSSSEFNLGTSHPPKTTVDNSETNMNNENFSSETSSQSTMTETKPANSNMNMNFGDNFFPSAPPTLSHYAHSQNFQQQQHINPTQFNVPQQAPPMPMVAVDRSSEVPAYHQHLNQLYGHTNRNRNRPQQHFNNDGGTGTEHNDGLNYYDHFSHRNKVPLTNDEFDSQNQYPLYRDNENNRKSPNHNQYLGPSRYPNQQSHHKNVVSSSNNNNHNNMPFMHQHQSHSTNNNFNLPSTSHPQDMMHDKIVDPLGKYENCRTINNIVVCADMTETDSKYRGQPISVLEHRHFQIGPTMNHHNSPSFDKPIYTNYNNGPQGTLNFNDNNAASHTSISGPGFPMPTSPSTEELHSIMQTIRPQDGNFVPSKVPALAVRPSVTSPMSQSVVTNKNEYQQQYQKPMTVQNHPTNELNLCKQSCGEGSICRIINSRPVCGCPQGYTGDPGIRCFLETTNVNTNYDLNSCNRHTDCPSTSVCLKSQCTDPCLIKSTVDKSNISSFHYSLDSSPSNNNMCGPNAKCSTIEHTPVCSCETNYYGNPYVGCVP